MKGFGKFQEKKLEKVTFLINLTISFSKFFNKNVAEKPYPEMRNCIKIYLEFFKIKICEICEFIVKAANLLKKNLKTLKTERIKRLMLRLVSKKIKNMLLKMCT